MVLSGVGAPPHTPLAWGLPPHPGSVFFWTGGDPCTPPGAFGGVGPAAHATSALALLSSSRLPWFMPRALRGHSAGIL